VLPFTRPAVPTHCSAQVNTARCVCRSINRRVREIVEWSGGASSNPTRGKSRNANESAARQAMPRVAPFSAVTGVFAHQLQPSHSSADLSILRVNAFEIADQQQPEIDARWQAGATHRLS